jgi:DNA-binding MarR family transcriptional regulator
MDIEAIARTIKTIPRLMHVLHRGMAPARAKDGLNATQVKTLMLLNDLEHRSMSDIAAFVDLDAGALSRVVEGLVQAELVVRKRDEADRRLVFAALTDAGRAVVERFKSELQIHLRRQLTPLSEEQAEKLLAALITIEETVNIIEEYSHG